MEERVLKYYYDMIRTGKKDSYTELFGKTAQTDKKYNQKDEIDVFNLIRYAVEYYMGWSKSYVLEHFDQETAIELKVDTLINRIVIPNDIGTAAKYRYIALQLYPDTKKDSRKFRKTEIIHAYEYMRDKGLTYKPKYFEGQEGKWRAIVLLRHVLFKEGVEGPTSMLEFYRMFAEPKISDKLNDWNLKFAWKKNYKYPLDYFHSCLTEKEQKDNESLYIALRSKLEKAAEKKAQSQRQNA